jgi:hypothetical protein
MALSTLKVNQITPRAGATKVVIADDLDINGNDVLNVNELNVTTINGPVATTSAKGLMASTDKSKLNNIEAQADVTDATKVDAAGALMESDFIGVGVPDTGVLFKDSTSGNVTYTVANDVVRSSAYQSAGFIKTDGVGGILLDGNTYISQNQSITVDGAVSGTGSTSITLTASPSLVTTQALTTTVDQDNDRFLVARLIGGSYELKSIAPSNMGFGSGSSSGGISSLTGVITDSQTVGGVMTTTSHTSLITGLSELDANDMSLANTFLHAYDGVGNSLVKITMQETVDFLNNHISGGGGSGGGSNLVGGLIRMFIQVTDGHLILEHSGAFTSTNFFIQSADNHLILTS